MEQLLEKDINVLIPEDVIQNKIKELAEVLNNEYKGEEVYVGFEEPEGEGWVPDRAGGEYLLPGRREGSLGVHVG